jgi:16S rRNA (adenine1518-N6/adenine1519-N6)-dimethyltransferase
MVAPAGEMSLVSLGVQVYASGRKLFDVAPGAFRPPPKVTSSVIRLDTREEPLVPMEERQRFFEVARAGFSAPRKQLRNALANGLRIGFDRSEAAIRAAGIDPALRPQKLSVADWLRLSRALSA